LGGPVRTDGLRLTASVLAQAGVQIASADARNGVFLPASGLASMSASALERELVLELVLNSYNEM